MCGRFTLSVELKEIAAYFQLESNWAFEYVPRYNIAPGQAVTAVIADDEGKRRIGQLRWGLIPYWAKDEKIGYKTINARVETIAEKASFRTSFRRKRCLIPADSYYEWKQTNNKQKIPYRIQVKDSNVFAFAGLYDTWVQPNGVSLHSCTIITAEANGWLTELHHRVPIILKQDVMSVWLDRSIQDPDLLHSLLEPYPSEEMTAYAVSTKVNKADNDTPDCIEPLTDDPESGIGFDHQIDTLF